MSKLTWQPGPTLPPMKDMPAAVRAAPAVDKTIVNSGSVDAA